MSNFTINIKHLPNYSKYVIPAVYLTGLFGYNVFSTYSDSKEKLIRFREKKLDKEENALIKNEWDAVKYGAWNTFYERLYNSFVYPLTFISNTIPWIVLKLNWSKSDE